MSDRVQLLVGLSTLAAFGIGWLGLIRPRLRSIGRRLSAALDTLGGRPEFLDEASGQRLPAIQPLHVRLAGIETAQADQAAALKALAEVQISQNELHRVAADHEARIGSLEDTDAERTLTREEAVEMWRALNNRDVIDVDPEGNAK